ncbi:MAG: radical SAM protein [Nanoarchaeota archaeon]|nr:radical SAM protein [Nanoarchaeota archaeon]
MIFEYMKFLAPRLIGYKLAMHKLKKYPPHPVVLNFSITNKCQSRCKTCNIWDFYNKNPKKEKEELKLWEIQKIFKTIKPFFLLNICGGEPFLRHEDIGEICKYAVDYCKAKAIHSPTNCLSPENIEYGVKDILKKIPKNVKLTIKMSLDGIGKDHDEIRGVEGNFEKMIDTHDRLIKIRDKHSNLFVDAGTTVSNLNADKLPKIIDWVHKNLKLDNFYHEIADTRAELFNIDAKEGENIPKDFKEILKDQGVTPTGDQYWDIACFLANEVKKEMMTKRDFSRISQALRVTYYERAAWVQKYQKRKIKCYAAMSNAHLNPWGGLWPCNVQAFKQSLGNIRDFDYNFDKLWKSKKAQKVRKWVSEEHCHCPLVGQAMVDTLLNPKEVLKTLYIYYKKKK